MNPLAKGKKFSVLFPDDFAERILPDEAEVLDLNVYRICLSGEINQAAFQSTYEDKYMIQRPQELDLENPSTFSTSCYEKTRDIRNSLKMFRNRNHPEAIIACGNTGVTDGLVLQEKKKKNHGKRSHVDWWIYRDHDVSPRFKDYTSIIMGDKKK